MGRGEQSVFHQREKVRDRENRMYRTQKYLKSEWRAVFTGRSWKEKCRNYLQDLANPFFFQIWKMESLSREYRGPGNY